MSDDHIGTREEAIARYRDCQRQLAEAAEQVKALRGLLREALDYIPFDPNSAFIEAVNEAINPSHPKNCSQEKA